MASRPPPQQAPPHSSNGRPARLRRPALLDLRAKSLLRGNLLVLGSLALAFLMSNFPQNRPTLWLALPTVISFYGMAETLRCLRRRWNFYHAGVVLCLYMDLMAISLIAFMLLYPYMRWLTEPR